MTSRSSLLHRTQGLLERTYGIRPKLVDPARFVIGDVGLRLMYRDRRIAYHAGASSRSEAATLVRESGQGVHVRVYLPDDMIRTLEAFPPDLGLGEENVDAFAGLVEELDHLLCLAERVEQARSVTLFELELHANVSKSLVLSRFLAGNRGKLDPRRRLWLRYQLFHKVRYSDEDPGVRSRYVDATRLAVRFLDALMRISPSGRLATLRAFHRAGTEGKVDLIRCLAG